MHGANWVCARMRGKARWHENGDKAGLKGPAGRLCAHPAGTEYG